MFARLLSVSHRDLVRNLNPLGNFPGVCVQVRLAEVAALELKQSETGNNGIRRPFVILHGACLATA
jgi:hypothetical protein